MNFIFLVFVLRPLSYELLSQALHSCYKFSLLITSSGQFTISPLHFLTLDSYDSLSFLYKFSLPIKSPPLYKSFLPSTSSLFLLQALLFYYKLSFRITNFPYLLEISLPLTNSIAFTSFPCYTLPLDTTSF